MLSDYFSNTHALFLNFFCYYQDMMQEDDYSDLEYGNLIYLFDSRTYQTKLVKLTSYELLAAKMACLETGMTLAQLVYTPQFEAFQKSVDEKYEIIFGTGTNVKIRKIEL